MRCLVVGAGPSLDFDYVKNFKGVIVCVDRTLKSLIKHGIEPDYCVSYEKGIKTTEGFTINPIFVAFFSNLPKVKTKFIFSEFSHESTLNEVRKSSLDYTIYQSRWLYVINNVGLFAYWYAANDLKADSIDIIGMDHITKDFPEYGPKCGFFREVFFELKQYLGVKTTIKNESI